MYLRYDTTRLKFNYPKFFCLKMMTENWNQKHAGKYSSILLRFLLNIFIQYTTYFPNSANVDFGHLFFMVLARPLAHIGMKYGPFWTMKKCTQKYIYTIDHINNDVNEARKIP